MTPLEIIGRVTATRLADLLAKPGTRALFGIMGLKPDVTSAIARAVSAISGVGPIEVFVHKSLKDGDIGSARESTRTATWHRNHPTDGVRATIFSVPAAQIRAVEQSLGHVTRIDESWLLERPQLWAEVALGHSVSETQAQFATVLEGLISSDLVVTPILLASFCARVAQTMRAGSMLDNAVRESLPALRLPRNAGDAKSSISASEWAARDFFQRLRSDAQPFLYRRAKDGETLASGELRRKLTELATTQSISADNAARVEALCDDRNVRDGQWSKAQADAAEIAWDDLTAIFIQTKKTEKPSFGQETRRLFDQEFRGTLTQEEISFLDGLQSDVAKPGTKIDAFFEAHRERLKKSPQLYRRWEKLIFKKPIEVDDLMEGLLRLIDGVCSEEESSGRAIYVWLRGSDQASFWANEKLKAQLLYLRDRYRGLDLLLAPEIVLDFGRCWTTDWEKQPVDGASGSTTIEFEAFLVDAEEVAAIKSGKAKAAISRAQMSWRPKPNAVGYSLPSDLRFLKPTNAASAFLLTGSAAENKRARRGASGIDLEDASSLIDAFAMQSGMLANSEVERNRVCARFRTALEELRADAVVSDAGADAISASFEAFRASYTAAIAALIDGTGLAANVLIDQAEHYGNLLISLQANAASEAGLRELVAPLLEIGSIQIEGKRPAAIVATWHPLRLAEVRAKALQTAEAAKAILASNAQQRTGASDFLESRVRTLSASYYADIGRGMGPRSTLLAETQRVLDCSMLEEAEGDGVRNIGEDGAQEAVDSLHRVSSEYLDLRPHERANFSIVLLGAESDDIPVLLAKSLTRLVDENPDVRCDLVVTHDDTARLRDLYESQNRRMASDFDNATAGDPSRSFMSRLRISLVGPDRLTSSETSKGSDLVLLQDVIARSALVRWVEGEPITEEVDFSTHIPTARSKRLPFKKRSVESGLYLTATVQPPAVVAWTNALHDVLVRQNTARTAPWLPLRWVEFVDTGVADVLKRAHALANWVVTFDRIADRRLIVQDDRRIIRYFSTPNSAHNVIVSAEVSSTDLGDRLNNDLAKWLPNASPELRDAVLKRLHAIAARLSGAVVMKAAQWWNFAQELIGLVLAERRLEGWFAETGDYAAASFFLDDNRHWLDLRGEMADIMSVAFTSDADEPVIKIVIAEAKYGTASSLNKMRTTSLRQLEATFTEMHRRLLLPETSLDPSIWRNRIADMLLEQMDPFDSVAGMSQLEWIEALRQQSVRIEVSGHSMVFSYDLASSPSAPVMPDRDMQAEERRPLAQWVHGQAEVVELLTALGENRPAPPLPLPKDWPYGGSDGGDTSPAENDDGSLPPTSPSLRSGLNPAATREAPASTNDAAAPTSSPLTALQPLNADAPNDAAGNNSDPSDPTGAPPELHLSEAMATDDAEEASGWPGAIASALARMSRVDDQAHGEAWLQQIVQDLQNALQAEGMDAPILDSRLTPNSGLIYVGARTLTVSWLERRQTDLLTRHRIDILRISPRPGSIAIAVRRPERAILHLADAWLRQAPSADAGPAERFAPVVGEKEDDGKLLYLPLAGDFGGQERAAPHTLVSGSTGSGKGILVTNLMLDLCARNAPDEIELYLIDPKRGLDYNWARRLPHLRDGIVSDQSETVALFEKLVAEMEERHEQISERGFRNIDQFNKRVAPSERLPRVVVFFDEVANWMQDDDFKKEVEALLNKIATKARAAGLHLVMIYQRADVQVMTMQLRTNLGNRLILRLPDEGSSKIALGEKGADRLLGKGHLIAKLDSDEKIYAQVPFIGEDDVEELVDAIAATWKRGAHTGQ